MLQAITTGISGYYADRESRFHAASVRNGTEYAAT